jgi:hypothetical protein
MVLRKSAAEGGKVLRIYTLVATGISAQRISDLGVRSDWELPSRIYGYMVLLMKTTVDLPDELLIEAKKQGAEQRRSLRRLLTDGLRAELRRAKGGQQPRRARRKKLRWVTVKGGLPPVDIADRAEMHEWIRRQR